MLPKTHLILGAIFSALLFLFFPQIGLIGATIVFLSSFLIDVDHYIYYVFKRGETNPIKVTKRCFANQRLAMGYSRENRKKFYKGFYFLHGIEVLIVLGFLAFFSKYFFYILLGFSIHLILDFIATIKLKARIHKISIIHDFLKLRKLMFIEG